jgi:hypothetical protein
LIGDWQHALETCPTPFMCNPAASEPFKMTLECL